MTRSKSKMPFLMSLVVASLVLPIFSQTTGRTMTLTDDIQMTRFIDPPPSESRTIVTKLSPDGRYFTFVTERGLIDKNVVEDTVWLVKRDDIENYVRDDKLQPPSVVPLLRKTYKDGPLITDVRWLENSSAVYFLAIAATGKHQLFRSDLKGAVTALTPDTQNVTGYAARGDEIVYLATSAVIAEEIAKREAASAFFASGQAIFDVVEPTLAPQRSFRSDLWVIRSGKRWRVENQTTHEPIQVQAFFVDSVGSEKDPAISPDGRFVVLPLPVPVVPKSWEQYHSPIKGVEDIRSGKQDPSSGWWWFSLIESYFLLDLNTGHAELLLDSPTGESAGFWNYKDWTATWSPDGSLVVLPSTFLPQGVDVAGHPSTERPCIVLYNLARHNAECVTTLRDFTEGNSQGIDNIQFVGMDSNTIKVNLYHLGYDDASKDYLVYKRAADGAWKLDDNWTDPSPKAPPFRLVVEQDLNKRPVLTAISKSTDAAKVLWDPNPEFASINLGAVSVFHWNDPKGREWEAGLVLPANYVRGKRYPLVIQTHGFNQHEFLVSGLGFTTNFAAQELAAAGIAVLQVGDGRYDLFTVDYLPGTVAAFESAVDKLVQDGIVDPDRVGISGFSATMLSALAAITLGKFHFVAASIADGETGGLQEYYLESEVDAPMGGLRRQYEQYFGAAPNGSGLQMWQARSPAFNLDRDASAVLIIHNGLLSTLAQWEIYARLAFLRKPVENLVVSEGTHPFTNPGQRRASQGATIDWYRFWLQSYEDPDPAKSDQYARWRGMRQRQETNKTAQQSAASELKK